MVIKLFKRTGLYSIGLLIGKLSTVVILIYLARKLQPGIFGDLILYTTLSQLIIFFSDFGLNQWYMIQADSQDKQRLFNDVFYARLTTLLPAIVFSIIFLIFTQSFSFNLSVIFIFSLIPGAFLSIIDGYYLERKQPIKIAAKEIIRNIFFIYFFFRSNLGLEEIFIVYLIANIFNLIILFPWPVISLTKLINFLNPFQTLKKSFPYGLLMLTSYFYARGDHLVIKYRLNSTALGLYGVAYRYLEGLSLIPSALTQNLFPLAAKKKGINFSIFVKISLLMIIGGLFISSLLFLLSNLLIIYLIGNQYKSAIPVLKIFSFVLFFFFLNSAWGTVVQASKELKNFLPYGFLNTVLNIVLNVIFVPKFGIIAASYVMLFTEFTNLLIGIYFINKIYFSKQFSFDQE